MDEWLLWTAARLLVDRVGAGYNYAAGYDSIEDTAASVAAILPADWGLGEWLGPGAEFFDTLQYFFSFLSFADYVVNVRLIAFSITFVLTAELFFWSAALVRYVRLSRGS